MRKNYPVTQEETKVRADQYLISKTDLKGKITYANPAFIEISGYSRDELIGKPHNLIRHPDMPPAAFQDLWDTLHKGKAWMGVVKNRRKDGGFYWVLANVTPIIVNDEVTGYASVRVKPSDDQVQAAETFYAQVNAGDTGGYTVFEGNRVPTGWRRALKTLAWPFSSSLRAGLFRAALLFIGVTGTATYHAVTGGATADQQPWLLGGIALGTLAALGYGWRVVQSVASPLEDAADIARQVAAGNLQLDIDNTHTGEIGTLYFSLDMMRKSLLGIASDVRGAAYSATHVAQNLETSNAQLAERTREQALSLQDTSTSMEQLTDTVRQNAENARLASQLADASMGIARKGGDVVNTVVSTMQGIHESSRKIGEIVTLIESIAFQTNILALNAAVESARAGAAGKGFAVVAGEVRSLAQKSSAAAKEIKQLIDESVHRMAAGAQHAQEAGHTMQEIVDSVHRVTDIMAEISSASAEQYEGLDRANSAIAAMDSGTQLNTNLVNALGTTVHALSAEAENLRVAIDVLSTGHQPATTSRNPVPFSMRTPGEPQQGQTRYQNHQPQHRTNAGILHARPKQIQATSSKNQWGERIQRHAERPVGMARTPPENDH